MVCPSCKLGTADDQLHTMYTSIPSSTSLSRPSSMSRLFSLLLTYSEVLGPVDGNTTPYDVDVPAGKKIRFNVRDSVNPGFDGSAFTDVVEIGKFAYLNHDMKANLSGAGTSDACLATGPIGTGGPPPYVYPLLHIADEQAPKRYRTSERIWQFFGTLHRPFPRHRYHR